MPFGLSVASSVFQCSMNSIFFLFSKHHISPFLDDILVATARPEEKIELIIKVIKAVEKKNLRFRMEKSESSVKKTEFLGFTISNNGVASKEQSFLAIGSWQLPIELKQVQSF
jgi:Reverse transcriptase (RNA-dependent DNA polymerase)